MLGLHHLTVLRAAAGLAFQDGLVPDILYFLALSWVGAFATWSMHKIRELVYLVAWMWLRLASVTPDLRVLRCWAAPLLQVVLVENAHSRALTGGMLSPSSVPLVPKSVGHTPESRPVMV